MIIINSAYQGPLREGRVRNHGKVFFGDEHKKRQESAAKVVEVVPVFCVSLDLSYSR